MTIDQIYEKFCDYSSEIQDRIFSKRSYQKQKESMIRFFATEVKSKNLEKEVLEKYPLLEYLFNGMNMKLEKNKLRMKKKKKNNEN